MNKETANAGLATDWLAKFLPKTVFSPANEKALRAFEECVQREAKALGNPLELRGAPLLRLKARLADAGYSGLASPSAAPDGTVSTWMAKQRQFVLGWHNLDFRDAAGVGHGISILRHAKTHVTGHWRERMKAGALIGIAMTEERGGTATHKFRAAAKRENGWWVLDGRKVSVSRIYEAEAFIVFCLPGEHGLTSVLIDAKSAGLYREPRTPSGLQGWSWGVIGFAGVGFADDAILGQPGKGKEVRDAHFEFFRPLVASTALGAAAAAWSLVRADIEARWMGKIIANPRDTALVEVAQQLDNIRNAWLGVLQPPQLPFNESSVVAALATSGKATAVDVAVKAVHSLRPLVSAQMAMIAGERFDKTLRDLEAYRFADGINEELWRGAGRKLIGG